MESAVRSITDRPRTMSGPHCSLGERQQPVVRWPQKVNLFGLGVTPTTYEEASDTIIAAGKLRQPSIVSCHAVHAIVTFSSDPELREKANCFQMITPDGQPVRWALNSLYKTKLQDRVCGPKLTLDLCRKAAQEGVSIYLYGGSPAVVEKLKTNLQREYPGLKVAGYESPPFRALSAEEDEAVVERINNSGAGLVFIGLGCPKQDIFAYEHRDRIKAVQLCVGAAFDFHAGSKRPAPVWMQKRGLEWFYRLVQEPRRLGGRYLQTNTIYLLKWARAFLWGPSEEPSTEPSLR